MVKQWMIFGFTCVFFYLTLFVVAGGLQLLTSSAVHKWGTEIHEGIYNMLMLLVELVAERVKQDPVPVNLMGVLTMVGSLTLFHKSF